MENKFKVHFRKSFMDFNFYEEGINEEISKRYDAEFPTLEEAIKYAQETYVPLFCEENADMADLTYDKQLIEYINEHEIREKHCSSQIINMLDRCHLCVEIQEKKYLDDSDLWDLRKEIRLGSMFISDYRNSYGIPPEEVCRFFDGYLDWLDSYGEDTADEKSLCEYWESFDENILGYYYRAA